jgi:hypothetical protein
MSSSFTIGIGEIYISLSCNHTGLFKLLGQRYQTFFAGSTSQFQLYINWEKTKESRPFITPDIKFDNNGIHLTGPGYSGSLNLVNQRADLAIGVSTPVEAVDYFLRVVSAVLIFEAQGMMVHGAGILHEGKGFLFFGHSGSGKTTVSKSSFNDIVLNDDLVVLMPIDQGWKMYSTPFWNPTQIEPKPVTAPLAAMYRLAQDKSVFITAFKPGQALAEIMANIPILTADTRRSKLLMDRCMSLLRNVPTFKLHFLPDNSFWQMIDAQQKGS